jgi:hypothetical protein
MRLSDSACGVLRLPACAASAAAAAVPTPTATTATAASAEAAATATCGFRTSFVDVHGPAVELGAIELRDCRFGLTTVRHFDEPETAGLARVTIGHDAYTLDAAVLGKRCEQLILSRLVTQVPDKDIGH